MTSPCTFCGQPWAPDHSAYCRARPTEENTVTALQDRLGIPPEQRSDPLLRDVKRLRFMLKERQQNLARRIHYAESAHNNGLGALSALVAYGVPWVSFWMLVVVGHGPFLTFMHILTSNGWPGDWPGGWPTVWDKAVWSVNRWGDPEKVVYALIAMFIVSPLLLLFHNKVVLREIGKSPLTW